MLTMNSTFTTIVSAFCNETFGTEIAALFLSSISLAILKILMIRHDDIED